MKLSSPEALLGLLLVPLLVGAYVVSRRRRRQRIASLAAQGLTTTAVVKRQRMRRHLPFAVFTVALVVLIVACARPMASIKTVQRQATVILALDVSNSMAATDVKPSRFAAAKSAASAFIREQPAAVRIGIVAFGPSAVIVQVPTTAHAAALQAINHLSLGGGTSLATGILTSLDAIAGKTLRINKAALANDDSGEVNIGYYGGATIALFSDGEDTSQTNPVTMARLASVAGVRVQTIGIGTTAGTTVQIGGFTVATALNPDTLKSVAMVTNGSYHQVGDEAALEAVSKTINLHFALVSRYIEITALFTLAAGALLVLGALMSVLWFGRVV